MTLYLEYRPQTFEDIVGQDFIKNTLSQAIIKDKLVGAYLFCGPRGTGKTSTARIFAKTINCLNLKDAHACGVCEVCVGMQNNSLVDVIEIDAASYTGVENIREIIDKAPFAPTLCRYKIYIIDEVHMLSKGAFNALLKILEEPPSHVKFILATTEIQKIPETILSRCQRYDFQSISAPDIKKQLLFIAKKEGIFIDDESIEYIIKQANGGLRNALSLFEQLNYNGNITYDQIVQNYGLPTKEIIDQFYQKLITRDVSIIEDLEEISQKYALRIFFKEILFYLRDKLLQQVGNKKNIDIHLHIIQTLEKAYRNSKLSFDEQTSFLVGILDSFTRTNTTLPSMPQTQKIQPKETTTLPKSTVSITSDDLHDLFSGEEEKSITKKETSQTKKKDIGDFSLTNLIEAIRKIPKSSSTSASLLDAKTQFDTQTLIIYSSGKMRYKMLSNPDSIAHISQALHDMGYENIAIEIK